MTSGSETTDPLNVYIGARIREERMASGLTQSRLGAAIGVTFQQIQKYERAASRVSVSTMVRIADALKLPIVAFLPAQTFRPVSEEDDRDVRERRELLKAFQKTPPARRGLLLALAREFASDGARAPDM
ncbi:transcriptional regulator [Pseudomonas sp. FW305-3-2-15-E-TSA4]|nr:transcriptional regulator [Pseudomonas sp. FW305-3-2-15-E-TSA4]